MEFSDEFVRFANGSPIVLLLALIALIVVVWLLAVIVFIKIIYGMVTYRRKLEATNLLLGVVTAIVSVVGFLFGVQSLPQIWELF